MTRGIAARHRRSGAAWRRRIPRPHDPQIADERDDDAAAVTGGKLGNGRMIIDLGRAQNHVNRDFDAEAFARVLDVLDRWRLGQLHCKRDISRAAAPASPIRQRASPRFAGADGVLPWSGPCRVRAPWI
jgi:hypothetical protein